MYALSYLEINTFCILIQLIILKHHLKNLDKGISATSFTLLQISMILYFCLDMVCGLQENGVLILTRQQNEIVNVGFFLSSYLVAFFSFAFAESELGRRWLKCWWKCVLSIMPLIVMSIATIGTLEGKYFFYIDENAHYVKGPYYLLMLAGAYGYIVLIALKSLYHLTQKKNYAQRKKLLMMSSFVVFPLIAGVLQAVYTGISIICLGGTIATVQVYISLQESRITLDTLTQINNRSCMMQQLENKMQNRPTHGDKSLFFLMLDMDQFKSINDTYGHVEGDEALLRLASALKAACSGYPAVLARYGGDEFCIVCEATDEEMKQLCFKIYQNIERVNRTAARPYDIRVSMGYAKATPDIQTIPDLIKEADRELYIQKKKRKNME